MNTEPHWTAYVSALAVPTVALVGATIAWLQWKLARNKLKFDLFERRLKVHDAAASLLSIILVEGKVTDSELFKFMVSAREAKWLFDSSVAQYLDKELYHKAVDLQTLASELAGLPVGEERTRNVHAQSEIKKWFTRQYDVLDEKFGPFLRLQH